MGHQEADLPAFLLGFPFLPELFWGADGSGSGATPRMIFSRTQ
jgi:hypothetical protein